MGSPLSRSRVSCDTKAPSPKCLTQHSRCSSLQSLASSGSASTKSRSLTAASSASTTSTTSMSGRFVSYDDRSNIIYIESDTTADRTTGSHSEAWNIRILPKFAIDDNAVEEPRTAPIVFGLCESSLLAAGYKHKYYSFGYSVTYCHGFRLCSYATSFNVDSEITIRYQRDQRLLSFWSDGVQEPRTITIPPLPLLEYALTVKSYDDQFAIQISKISSEDDRCFSS